MSDCLTKLSDKWQTRFSMEKRTTVRLEEGTYLLIEANAKKQGQTVSDWIRAAIQEQIKRTVNSRILDRIDERVYTQGKELAQIKAMLTRLQETMNNIEFVEE